MPTRSKELSRTFEEVSGYQDMVMLRDISLESHCEHHMVAILDKVHIAYVPTNKVVGISKLARVVDIYAKRLQTQETMTAQIVDAITQTLAPAGVAILVDAKHQCMTTRCIKKPDVATITSQFTGVFREDPRLEARFMQMARLMRAICFWGQLHPLSVIPCLSPDPGAATTEQAAPGPRHKAGVTPNFY